MSVFDKIILVWGVAIMLALGFAVTAQACGPGGAGCNLEREYGEPNPEANFLYGILLAGGAGYVIYTVGKGEL
jgi:hypothetical protein